MWLLQSSRELKFFPLTEFCRDFPGGPVVKTLLSSVGAVGSILAEELRSYMSHDQKKKKIVTNKDF